MKTIRHVPAVEDRVETGAVQFGEDWPGLFVRGDDCLRLAQAYHAMKLFMRPVPRGWDMVIAAMDELIQTIARDVDCGDAVAKLLADEEADTDAR